MTLKTECKLNSLGALSLGEAGQLSGERNVCPTVHSCSCCSSLSLPAVWVQVDTLVSQPAASLTCPTIYWTPAACSHHARASRVAQSPRSQPGLSACWHVGARLRLHPLRALRPGLHLSLFRLPSFLCGYSQLSKMAACVGWLGPGCHHLVAWVPMAHALED